MFTSYHNSCILIIHELHLCFQVPLPTPGPPAPLTAPPRIPLTAQTVPMIGPKKGQLIDYGRLFGPRAAPIGWILAFVSGLLLLPVALAFAARKCTQGACLPGAGRSSYVPVLTEAEGVTQTENGLYKFLVILLAKLYIIL